MIDIKQINTVYVHDEDFNADDIVSTAILLMVNKDIIIKRVENMPSELNENEIILDLELCNDDNTLSSLVFEWCYEYLFDKVGIIDKEKAKEVFYQNYLNRLATRINNEFCNDYIFRENRILLAFNAYWYEKVKDKSICDEQFRKATDLMMMVLENWLKDVKEEADLRQVEDSIWKKATDSSDNGIYILERYIPWQFQIKKNPTTNARIIIFKSNRGGYNIMSKSIDELKIKKSEYLTFIHPSGFMGVASSLENAILAARQSLASAS